MDYKSNYLKYKIKYNLLKNGGAFRKTLTRGLGANVNKIINNLPPPPKQTFKPPLPKQTLPPPLPKQTLPPPLPPSSIVNNKLISNKLNISSSVEIHKQPNKYLAPEFYNNSHIDLSEKNKKIPQNIKISKIERSKSTPNIHQNNKIERSKSASNIHQNNKSKSLTDETNHTKSASNKITESSHNINQNNKNKSSTQMNILLIELNEMLNILQIDSKIKTKIINDVENLLSNPHIELINNFHNRLKQLKKNDTKIIDAFNKLDQNLKIKWIQIIENLAKLQSVILLNNTDDVNHEKIRKVINSLNDFKQLLTQENKLLH